MEQELNPDIAARFVDAKKRTITIRAVITFCFVILEIVFITLGGNGIYSNILGWLIPVVFIVSILAIMVLERKVWRCPACNNYLAKFKANINPFGDVKPLYCPNCGKRLT